MQIKVYYLINYWTMYRTTQFLKLLREMGEQGWSILTMDGTMARELSFQECGLGSVPRLGIIHVSGLSLLTLYSAPKGLSPGTPVFPFPKKQHLI